MTASQRYSTFYLNGISFGVPVEEVQEVLEFQQITPIPLSSAVLPGIINLRGQILTTIDLKVRLALAAGESGGQPMMMVVRTNEGPFNLLVDKIGPVLEVDPALFEKPAETFKPAVRAAVAHVCKLENCLLLVLDTQKIVQLADEHECAAGPEPSAITATIVSA